MNNLVIRIIKQIRSDMKTIKLSIAGIAALILIFSCNSNKQAQLSKLKEQQTSINDKIKTLETETPLR